MRRFIRSPLTWMVVVELFIVGTLLVVAWNLVGSSLRPAFGSPVEAAPQATGDDSSPLPDIPGLVGQPGRGPLPGLNLSSSFWRARPAGLDRDQVLVAQLEWHVVPA